MVRLGLILFVLLLGVAASLPEPAPAGPFSGVRERMTARREARMANRSGSYGCSGASYGCSGTVLQQSYQAPTAQAPAPVRYTPVYRTPAPGYRQAPACPNGRCPTVTARDFFTGFDTPPSNRSKEGLELELYASFYTGR